MSQPILPGATIGILGSGQLGRMLAIAARRMGYRIHTLSPFADTPTGQVADAEIVAAYDDLEAVRAFSRQIDVLTYEFENIPATTVEAAAAFVPARPGIEVLHITQNRAREKNFLARSGFPVTPFKAAQSQNDIVAGIKDVGLPAILKTAGFGYDGKGQYRINSLADVDAAIQVIGNGPWILESLVDFDRELSVVGARGLSGNFVHYGAIENTHRHHILDVSVAPVILPPGIAKQAVDITRGIFEMLDVVGVLCVEFFLTQDGKLLVNELAPRPHNSGHLTFDACITSQFEQQLRAVCGLPLGSTRQLSPAAMVNLLGDLWQGGEPDWAAACTYPDVKLHLYGKQVPRPGRKMGHLTALAATPAIALEQVLAARATLWSPKLPGQSPLTPPGDM
ncbi:MAG: 5-(carboxyamino)imidazole ribonucleotide synthase [Chloroflexi bacterium]|nr:5-(carboxyamino)imidazole ribonucleotide synthase [Chloroflexota bacterium]